MTNAGMIEFLIKNIKSIKFPLLNVEEVFGSHTVNNLYLDKYNRLYVDYTSYSNFNRRTWVTELNSLFVSNIYKKALNQTFEDVWKD
jgi:hypothetical protein